MAATTKIAAARALFIVLDCIITATVAYTLTTDGLPFRRELLTPWMTATLVDFYINVVAIAVWIAYKESNCISACIWIIMLICLGSITTCTYVVLQLFNISSEDSIQDPVYHVLRHYCVRSGSEKKMKCCSVIIGRIVFSILGCVMLATLIYTLLTDGSPFRRELLTPWLTATLIDFYINVVAIVVWVSYKESSWIGAFIWIILLICFGSITTCAYIVIQLFKLSPEDPFYLIFLAPENKQNHVEGCQGVSAEKGQQSDSINRILKVTSGAGKCSQMGPVHTRCSDLHKNWLFIIKTQCKCRMEKQQQCNVITCLVIS